MHTAAGKFPAADGVKWPGTVKTDEAKKISIFFLFVLHTTFLIHKEHA